MESILKPKDSWASALEDVADYVGATPEQHYLGLDAALELAAAILAGRSLSPGWDAQEPISEAARTHLEKLRQRAVRKT